jgi:Uma2 family endonuclease
MSTVQLKLGPADHGRPLSLDDFESANYEPGFKYEIIDGRLYVSYEPDPTENELELWLMEKLNNYKKLDISAINHVTNKGRVFVHSRRYSTIPEPDIAAFSDYPLPHLRQGRKIKWSDVSPILVVEVLVEGGPEKDLVRNPRLYLEVPTIQEYWVLDGREDAEKPTLMQHRRHGGRWVIRSYPYGSTFTTELLPGFSLIIDPLK